MSWEHLQEDIVELFDEARRAGRSTRLSLWCLRAHSSRLERRRAWYSIRKQIQPGWYARMLERQRANAKLYRVTHPEWYRRCQEQKAERNFERRAHRTRNLVCAKCHKEFHDRSGRGPVPKYCSLLCNRRAAALSYYHRKRDASKQKSGASGRFFVTPHAVSRYRQRVHRGISYERALEEIMVESERAHFVKRAPLAYRGIVEYWRGPKPMRIRLVVKQNHRVKLPTIVTVLPAADNLRSR